MPSPVEGTFLRVLAAEGETVPMGAPIAEMETADTKFIDRKEAPAQAASEAKANDEAGNSGTTGYLVKDARPVGPTGSVLGEGDEPDSAAITGPPPGGAARPSPRGAAAGPRAQS